jgi:hypothetical protein
MGEELKIIKQNSALVRGLYEFCKQNLQFNEEATIVFLINQNNALNPLGKTAYYSPDEKKVAIYVVGRHIKDILRSLAHELIHHSQNERGSLNSPNATEGYFLKDENMVELEREAYEKGNMLFRQWEELIKSKQ